MPLWVIILTVGLATACLAFIDYVEIPRVYLPVFIVAAALHGYLSDIYNFPMSYLLWGLGWLFVAATLETLRRINGVKGLIIASMFATLTLMSYQPFILILLFASALAYVNVWSKGATFERDAFALAWRPFVVFLLSSGIFLIAVKFLGPEDGRPVSAEFIIPNLGRYFATIYGAFTNTNSIGLISPLHERIVYGLGIIIGFAFFGALAIQRRSVSGIIVVVALLCAIAIGPNPFNLFIWFFWPTPRSMSGAVFFQIGIVLLLLMRLPDSFRSGWVATIALLAFFGMSAINQVAIYTGSSNQSARDEAVAKQILASVNSQEPITTETKIAVSSTWHNAVQKNATSYMDGGQSAFNQIWSNWRILHMNSAVDFQEAKVPDGACKMPIADWVVERRDGVFVVCMN